MNGALIIGFSVDGNWKDSFPHILLRRKLMVGFELLLQLSCLLVRLRIQVLLQLSSNGKLLEAMDAKMDAKMTRR